MAESRWQDIFLHLKRCGFDVYAPGQKTGECRKEYVVVRQEDASADADVSSTHHYYDILCYVPANSYSRIEPFFLQVKEAMKGLYPMIRPTDTDTPPYLDTTVKAHMMSSTYENIRKIERR